LCLRNFSAEEVLFEVPAGYPVIDGVQILGEPVALFQQGLFNRKAPLLLGRNAVEGNFITWFWNNDSTTITPSGYKYLTQVIFSMYLYSPQDVSDVLKWYNQTIEEEGLFDGISVMFADTFIDCGTSYIARAMANHSASVFYYYFTHPTQNWDLSFLNCTHLTELPYVFNTSLFGSEFDADEQRLSNSVVEYWHAFHLTGNPNTNGQSVWPVFSPADPSVLNFDIFPNGTFPTVFDPADSLCPLWLPWLLGQNM